jgi:hypothetical protein
MAPGFVILVVDGPDGAQRIIGPPAPGLAAPPLTIDHQFAEREEEQSGGRVFRSVRNAHRSNPA